MEISPRKTAWSVKFWKWMSLVGSAYVVAVLLYIALDFYIWGLYTGFFLCLLEVAIFMGILLLALDILPIALILRPENCQRRPKGKIIPVTTLDIGGAKVYLRSAKAQEVERFRNILPLMPREMIKDRVLDIYSVFTLEGMMHFGIGVGAHRAAALSCSDICFLAEILNIRTVTHEFGHSHHLELSVEANAEWIESSGGSDYLIGIGARKVGDKKLQQVLRAYQKTFGKLKGRHIFNLLLEKSKDSPTSESDEKISYPAKGILSEYGATQYVEDIAEWVGYCYAFLTGEENIFEKIDKTDARYAAKLTWLHKWGFLTDDGYAKLKPLMS